MNHLNLRQDKEVNLIHLIIQKFLPFWPLLLALAVLGLVLAKVYTLFQTPEYKSTASLIVNDAKKGADQSQLMESFNVFESKKIVENEIEILRSKDIIKDVIYELGLYVQIYAPNIFGDKLLYQKVPVNIILKDSLDINTEATISKVEFSVDYKKGLVKMNNKDIPFNTWTANPFGGSELKFVPTKQQYYKEGETFKFKIVNPRLITNQILADLYVNTTSKLASVVSLQLNDPIPERGNAILNQLILSYKKAAINNQISLASNTLKFIDNRITEVVDQLNAVEKDLENYRALEGVINLGEQGNLYLQNVGDYDKRISEINLQLSVLEKVERYVIDKNKNSGIVPSTLGVNDPILGQLLQRLYDAEIQYEELSKTTAENNPILVTLRNKIEKIRPSILENVGSLKSNLLASRESLISNSGKYNSALGELPGQERIYAEITRKRKSISDLYDFLLQKREEAALSLAPTIGNVRVIEQAEATINPVSPKKKIIYLIGFITPLLFGFSWVAGKELLNSKVLFRSELETETSVPVIGELNYLDLPYKQKLITAHKNLYNIDQFRQITSDLTLFQSLDKSKTILITSSIQDEGKSYVSANLALTLALSGKKTALIDLDLRKAGISKLFNLDKKPGISEFLTGKTRELPGIEKDYGLRVFPAGKPTSDSTNLLLQNSLKNFITTIQNSYEVILIDTPPTSLVSDASIIAPYSDLSLIIVRHNHTPKSVLHQIEGMTTRKKLKNSHIIFNGLKPRGFIKKYNYGYGYNAV